LESWHWKIIEIKGQYMEVYNLSENKQLVRNIKTCFLQLCGGEFRPLDSARFKELVLLVWSMLGLKVGPEEKSDWQRVGIDNAEVSQEESKREVIAMLKRRLKDESYMRTSDPAMLEFIEAYGMRHLAIDPDMKAYREKQYEVFKLKKKAAQQKAIDEKNSRPDGQLSDDSRGDPHL
jgi:hypothetical protein